MLLNENNVPSKGINMTALEGNYRVLGNENSTIFRKEIYILKNVLKKFPYYSFTV